MDTGKKTLILSLSGSGRLDGEQCHLEIKQRLLRNGSEGTLQTVSHVQDSRILGNIVICCKGVTVQIWCSVLKTKGTISCKGAIVQKIAEY